MLMLCFARLAATMRLVSASMAASVTTGVVFCVSIDIKAPVSNRADPLCYRSKPGRDTGGGNPYPAYVVVTGTWFSTRLDNGENSGSRLSYRCSSHHGSMFTAANEVVGDGVTCECRFTWLRGQTWTSLLGRHLQRSGSLTSVSR